MLTRRHIRIKVLHALYGFEQRDEKDMAKSIKDLKNNLDAIYDLYLYELKALLQFLYAAQERIEVNKKKHLPTKEDLSPNTRFVDNKVLNLFDQNAQLTNWFESRNIKWGEHRDKFKRMFKELTLTEEYMRYMVSERTLPQDKKLMKFIYGRFLAYNEDFHALYEDMNMNWADDLDAAQMMVVKTMKVMMEVEGTTVSKANYSAEEVQEIEAHKKLPEDFNFEQQKITVDLFKDKADKEFGPHLFTKTINHFEEFGKLIAGKTANWESDRIALVDITLMKMALTEMMEFPEIPVKVTLNEYIELSKMYSTPKSSQFINGVLDNMASEFRKAGKIKKLGRGLL